MKPKSSPSADALNILGSGIPSNDRKRDPEREAYVKKLELKFNRYFSDVSSNIGHGDQETFKQHRSQSTYGYLTFGGMEDMLAQVETNGKIFYDLGSGVGKPPLAALMLYPDLKKAIGIELSKARHEQGMQVIKKIKNANIESKLQLIQGSMLDMDFCDADIIYISSLCFSIDFQKRLGNHLDSCLRKGTIVMSSKALPLARATLKGRTVVGMSWNSVHQLHEYEIVKPLDQKGESLQEKSSVQIVNDAAVEKNSEDGKGSAGSNTIADVPPADQKGESLQEKSSELMVNDATVEKNSEDGKGSAGSNAVADVPPVVKVENNEKPNA